MNKISLKAGIIGIGGFAKSHHTAVYELEKQKLVKLLCTCDVSLEKLNTIIDEMKLKERNIKIFTNFIDMLDKFKNKLDLVTIPTPIHLHYEMHRECVKRSVPVYLEKPPTLDYFELLDMIKFDVSAIKETSVGFNYIIQELRQKIKNRILSGEFGKIKKITFLGMWPRPVSYFNRSSWSGKLFLNNKLVLDSCFGNAISHYVHNILFWAGKNGIFSWDTAKNVEAELYRANNIEGTDTVFVLTSTENVPDIRIAMTHACSEKKTDIEKIYCENAEIHFEGNSRKDEETTQAKCEIFWNNGKKETITQPNGNLLLENILYYIRYISDQHSRPLTRLIDTEPFVKLNGLMYIAGKKIHNIPQENKQVICDQYDNKYIVIKKIEEVGENFVENALFPSQQKIRWGKKGGKAKKDEIGKLHQTIKMMLNDTTQ